MPRAAQGNSPEPSTLRLRITFGGGQARRWTGWITLSDGRFRDPRLLGLEPDEPGSMGVGVRAIQISQPSPRSYDGLDISIDAPLNTLLRIRLAAVDNPSEQKTFEFKLAELVSGAHPVGSDESGQLDVSGNRVVVSRAPGDRLRIRYERPTLVFAPGESFQFDVLPHLTGVAVGEEVRMQMRITSQLSGKELYHQQRDMVADRFGGLPAWGPHEFQLPAGDDVYQLSVAIHKSSILDPLAPVNPLASAKPLIERRLQFVALSSDSQKLGQPRSETLVDDIDPIQSNWSERVARWPLLKRIPRMAQGRLEHGEVKVMRHQGSEWATLEPDAWQAHMVSIDAPCQPHVLEVTYPDDLPQTLGISIIEPNSVGEVSPLGVDTAVEVPAPAIGAVPGKGRHRLVFWPRTRTPVILLKSHDQSKAAIYGRLKIYRISGDLPSEKSSHQQLNSQQPVNRIVGAWLDKPLLPEMFAADEAADQAIGRSLDDWRTFYQGVTRLAAHLDFAGYNSAVVPALCEGSSLYPSTLLESTPKYDTGIYLSNGEDPQRKDVLEMMFRIFDREGLVLFPSLQFDTPLPGLERLRTGNERVRPGIELVNAQGQTWLQLHSAHDGLAPFYNPLDPRVRQAMVDVVKELTQRYGHHASFGGVVLQLSPHGYSMLPGHEWGFDDVTFSQFLADMKMSDPGIGRDRFKQRARWTANAGRERWLTWRASQMTSLYRGIAGEIARLNPSAQLILAGPEMLDGKALRQVMLPTLAPQPSRKHRIREALLELGIDPKQLNAEPGMRFVTPHPELLQASARAAKNWDAMAVNELHTQLKADGVLIYRSPTARRVASFDASSPFGPNKTYTWLAPQVSQHADASRSQITQALTQDDRTIIFHGGWMVPRGQEDHTAATLRTLSLLPARKLADAPASPASQPITMRTHESNDGTIVCLVNNSQWPVKMHIHVQAKPLWKMLPLLEGGNCGERDGKVSWTVTMRPYDIVAARFNQNGVKLRIEDIRLPDRLRENLVSTLQDVRRRTAALKSPHSLMPILNAGFDQLAMEAGGIPEWLHASGNDIEVSLVEKGFQGSRSALKLGSRGSELWLRSRTFEPPRTGRIAVLARLRVDNAETQPELRLAIEARRNGQPYYRFANVGAGVASAKLSTHWAPFILHIDDLPREGLNDFRVGFDLMGPGQVYVDQVEVFDLTFSEKEQFQISRLVAAADFHLREDNLAAAAQVLDGYWLRFLQQHVEPFAPETNEPPLRVPPSAPQAPPQSEPSLRQSFLDRARGYWPF